MRCNCNKKDTGTVPFGVETAEVEQFAVQLKRAADEGVPGARIGGSVTTCSPYKCKLSDDGETMICTRRCTTIKAGSMQEQQAAMARDFGLKFDGDTAEKAPPSPGKGCYWDCKEVNGELTICTKVCGPKPIKPVADPWG